MNYGKCSKIFEHLELFLFLKDKMLVFLAGNHKMVVRIANREDPDQTASSEAVSDLGLCRLSRFLGRQLLFEIFVLKMVF